MKKLLSVLTLLFLFNFAYSCSVYVELAPNWDCTGQLEVCWASTCQDIVPGESFTIPNGQSSVTFQTSGCLFETWFEIFDNDGTLLDHIDVQENFPLVWETSCSALPVELSMFTASMSDKFINFEWETESEYNVKQFDIQLSVDGFNFNLVNTVYANNLPSLYRASVSNLFVEPIIYARLKIIDLDGSFEYSRVLAIGNIQTQLPGEISMYNSIGQKIKEIPSNSVYFVTDGNWVRKVVSLKN